MRWIFIIFFFLSVLQIPFGITSFSLQRGLPLPEKTRSGNAPCTSAYQLLKSHGVDHKGTLWRGGDPKDEQSAR